MFVLRIFILYPHVIFIIFLHLIYKHKNESKLNFEKITHRSFIIITKNIKKNNYLNIKSNGFNSKSLIRRASSSFKHNASFVARLPTIRRHKSQSLHSPGNLKPSGGSQRGRNCPRTMNEINNSAENLGRLPPLARVIFRTSNFFWFSHADSIQY